jgi:hypothetical protein
MDSGDKGKTGHRELLRERFLHGDSSSRSDAALLELLLTFGTPRRDVQRLAETLLARFGNREHKCSPGGFRSKSGPKKFGQELMRSKLPEGRLRGRFEERFAHIYDQITKLGGYELALNPVQKSFAELNARLNILVATASYQEFDTAVRESYAAPEKFKEAFAEHDKARKLRDRACEISQAGDYLAAACDLRSGTGVPPLIHGQDAQARGLNVHGQDAQATVELDRKTNLGFFRFDTLFASPHLIPARLDSFEKWKGNYIQAYRKAHRAFYESLEKIAASAQALRPRVIALNRLNSVGELGPPLTGTGNLETDLDQLESATWLCPDAVEAEVAGTNAVCPKCDWTPAKVLPQKDCERVSSLIAQGLADRIQRLEDASIAAILKKAADESHRADLKSLLEIIQIADADKLVGVITDDLVTFLRKLLQEANIVHETVALQPILNQIGAVEEERIEEALSKLTSLLRTATKNAKAKHSTGRRVRVLFRLEDGDNS